MHAMEDHGRWRVDEPVSGGAETFERVRDTSNLTLVIARPSRGRSHSGLFAVVALDAVTCRDRSLPCALERGFVSQRRSRRFESAHIHPRSADFPAHADRGVVARPTHVLARTSRFLAIANCQRAATLTGVDEFVVVPFPSWPEALSPQQLTLPLARAAHECDVPAVITIAPVRVLTATGAE